MLLKCLVEAFFAEAKLSSFRSALPHFFGSMRALRDPEGSRQVFKTLDKAGADRWLRRDEHFFHIRHRFYLSQRLSRAQRLASVLHHYAYEGRQFLPTYRQQVYGGPGLLLWQADIDGHAFRVRLAASTEMRWEGDLSVELFVDDVRLHVMSFAYVDASLFGLEAAPILFITRNQAHRAEPGQGNFRAAFKHTVPPYFCLAAVVGIATANGMSRLAAVQHEAQIACTPEVSDTLKNSYDEFWRAFQGTELDGGAFLLPVPMATVPVSELKAKHRKRAIDRREAWAAVTNSARAAVAAQLVQPREAPIAPELALVPASLQPQPQSPPRAAIAAVTAVAVSVANHAQVAQLELMI